MQLQCFFPTHFELFPACTDNFFDSSLVQSSHNSSVLDSVWLTLLKLDFWITSQLFFSTTFSFIYRSDEWLVKKYTELVWIVQLVQILTILHYFSISQITFGEKHVVNFASAAMHAAVQTYMIHLMTVRLLAVDYWMSY